MNFDVFDGSLIIIHLIRLQNLRSKGIKDTSPDDLPHERYITTAAEVDLVNRKPKRFSYDIDSPSLLFRTNFGKVQKRHTMLQIGRNLGST